MGLEPDDVEDIRIEAKRLLRAADAIEVFPTPVDQLVETAGLLEVSGWALDDSLLKHASEETLKVLRRIGRKVRGTLDRRERVIQVAPDMHMNRRRFVQCHEVTHDILPWQRELLVFADDDKTLAPNIQALFEQQANQGAAELLFQLDTFTDMARDCAATLETPVELAAKFGASIHASIRRWVEGHDHALCVLVLKPEPVSRDPLRFHRDYVITSKKWAGRFGTGLFKQRELSTRTLPFLAALVDPWMLDIDAEWTLPGLDGEMRAVKVSSFTTGYSTFVLLRVPQRDRLAARFRKRPTIVNDR